MSQGINTGTYRKSKKSQSVKGLSLDRSIKKAILEVCKKEIDAQGICNALKRKGVKRGTTKNTVLKHADELIKMDLLLEVIRQKGHQKIAYYYTNPNPDYFRERCEKHLYNGYQVEIRYKRKPNVDINKHSLDSFTISTLRVNPHIKLKDIPHRQTPTIEELLKDYYGIQNPTNKIIQYTTNFFNNLAKEYKEKKTISIPDDIEFLLDLRQKFPDIQVNIHRPKNEDMILDFTNQ